MPNTKEQPQTPTHTDAGAQKSQVYVVQIILPSPNRTDGTERIDDQTVQTHYIFKEEMRKRISALRQRIRDPIFKELLDFPSEGESKLWLCNSDKIERIKQKMVEAETQFQALDTSLHARAIFLPIDIYESEAGDLYRQIIDAIRYRVLAEVIDKIGEKAGQLPEKSRDAMLNLIGRMKSINIFNDPDVTKRLGEIREKVLNEDLATVKKELMQELDITRQRIAYVNF